MKNLSKNIMYLAISICSLIGITLFIYSKDWNIHRKIFNVYHNKNDDIISSIRNDLISDICAQSNKVKMNTKVLSYSMYGSWAKDPKRVDLLVYLAKQAISSTLYKDWVLRVYHDENFPTARKQTLRATYKNMQFCDIRTIPYYGDLSRINGREWRFLPIGDKTVDVMCSRDIDSPFIEREYAAVQEWLESNISFHCMRDSPHHHKWPIFAGMFCFRNNKNRTLTKLVFDAIQSSPYRRSKTFEPHKSADQELLRDHVLPIVKNDMMRHDSYNCKEFPNSFPFPTKRLTSSSGFVGCFLPCSDILPECPLFCRPANHQDWKYC